MDRRNFMKFGGMAVAVASVMSVSPALALPRNESSRVVSFFNTHTQEKLTTSYKKLSSYLPGALKDINRVLRDHRTGDVHTMDPRLIDLLYDLKRATGTSSPFHVISGYRSPKSNALLHKASNGVANNSYHMKGMAIDIRLPDVPLQRLHKTALALKRGGVGIYTGSNFVHVDVGPVRHWGG